MNWDKLTFKAVDQQNWKDLESLFESRGGPHNCWCMVWRKKEGKDISKKEGKKEALKDYVERNIPIGLLCYQDHNPIAWCSIASRESYKNLGGDDTKENVWSIACFFIKRPFRNINLTSKLIEQAILYAQKNGARYLEAYPVEKDSPSYRFMGFRPSFEKVGFDFVHMAGKRRHVMIKKI